MTTPTPDTVEQAATEWLRMNLVLDSLDDGEPHSEDVESLTALLLQREEAARREGWKAGAEAALKIADDPRYVRWVGGSTGDALGTALGIAAAIRALPEMKKE